MNQNSSSVQFHNSVPQVLTSDKVSEDDQPELLSGHPEALSGHQSPIL